MLGRLRYGDWYTRFDHCLRVPSVIDSAICGTLTTVSAVGRQLVVDLLLHASWALGPTIASRLLATPEALCV